MKRRSSTMEWIVAKNDTDWAHLCTQSPLKATPGGQSRLFSLRSLGQMAALLLLLALVGGWRWQSDQARTKQSQAELTPPIQRAFSPEERLETLFFVFHYPQRDAQVVVNAAPLVDELYITLCRNFGLLLTPAAEKLVINVSVTQRPGATLVQPHPSGQFSVPSPAAYLAPVALTDTELLVQSIALPLIDHLLAAARKHHAISSRWQPLLDAFQLWQVWDLDLPLAVWREEIVQWIAIDLPAADTQQPIGLPAHYAELCAMHGLWMKFPVQIQIPLFCNKFDGREWFFTRWQTRHPPTHLVDLFAPAQLNEYAQYSAMLRKEGWVNYPGAVVVRTMLLEYALTTYGREYLPALVAGLGQHKTWDTLVPAVFGVSSAEFETGWPRYLAAYE